MFFVFRHGGQFESQKGDDCGTAVGQVVHPVGNDGDAAGKESHCNLHQAEDCIGEDSHDAGQLAVGITDLRAFYVGMVFDEGFEQEVVHLLTHCLFDGLCQLIRAGGLLETALDAGQSFLHFFHLHTLYQGADALQVAVAAAHEFHILHNTVFNVQVNLTGADTVRHIIVHHVFISPFIVCRFYGILSVSCQENDSLLSISQER